MENFRMAIGNEIEWVQPRVNQRSYALCAGETVFARMRFETSLGTLASAVTVDGNWTFKRVGFIKTRVLVRRTGEETALAVFTPNWSGRKGAIQFTAGRNFIWKTANFLGNQYQMLDSLSNVVMTYKLGKQHSSLSDILKIQARVKIDPAFEDLPELPVLVLLGWYLMILRHHDNTATATAATTSAT